MYTPEIDDLPTLARRVRRHHTLLVGDPELKEPGLLERMKTNEDLIKELVQTKREVVVRIEMLIAAVAFMGLTQFNNFLQLLQTLFGNGAAP